MHMRMCSRVSLNTVLKGRLLANENNLEPTDLLVRYRNTWAYLLEIVIPEFFYRYTCMMSGAV